MWGKQRTQTPQQPNFQQPPHSNLLPEHSVLPQRRALPQHPQLTLGGNFYGVGGRRTSLRECLVRDGDGFGWNWTRGRTNASCEAACQEEISLVERRTFASP